MVICRDILASFTVMFAALSLVFTVAATTGVYTRSMEVGVCMDCGSIALEYIGKKTAFRIP